MTKIYAVVNQKGGVGKTTSVINLSAYLASNGRKTLLIDIDPQANATSGLGVNKNAVDPTTYDILLEQATLDEAVLSLPEFKIDILPSNPALSGAEVELVNAIGREYRLQKALEGANGRYDYVLIDCPPSLSLLTINALTAAKDGVLIPVQCEYLALEGLTQLNQTIELVQNPDILADVAALAKPPLCVGFAAESRNLAEYAEKKRRAKKIPLIVGNLIQDGFGGEENKLTLFDDKGQTPLPVRPKMELARALIVHIAGLLEQR